MDAIKMAVFSHFLNVNLSPRRNNAPTVPTNPGSRNRPQRRGSSPPAFGVTVIGVVADAGFLTVNTEVATFALIIAVPTICVFSAVLPTTV